jgi:hypothetical protein
MKLIERFVNVLDVKEKESYADIVWDMIQTSYKPSGGIKGSGFSSKEDMFNNIPFWKIAKKNGKVVAVILYKDKGGRKRVAAATDGSVEGKNMLARMMKDDLTQQRSYAEVSGPSLGFIIKKYGDGLSKHVILPSEAENILGVKLDYPVPKDDKEVVAHPELHRYFYIRDINGTPLTKLMMGTPGQSIK